MKISIEWYIQRTSRAKRGLTASEASISSSEARVKNDWKWVTSNLSRQSFEIHQKKQWLQTIIEIQKNSCYSTTMFSYHQNTHKCWFFTNFYKTTEKLSFHSLKMHHSKFQSFCGIYFKLQFNVWYSQCFLKEQ